MMILLSAETGFLQALLADNGYLTDLRTGLAGAVVARHLAPAAVHTAGVVGSGSQARYQIRGLRLVRDFERLMVYGVVEAEAQRYAEEMERELGVPVIVAATPETVVRQSEFVVTTTPSREPYLEGRWLHPGVHVTCMGSDMEDKHGAARRLLRARRPRCLRPPRAVRGHRRTASRLGRRRRRRAGRRRARRAHRRRSPGRSDDRQITICDLTGVGVQDTIIARLAFARAIERGLGTTYDSV